VTSLDLGHGPSQHLFRNMAFDAEDHGDNGKGRVPEESLRCRDFSLVPLDVPIAWHSL
jgi:hypothetical protein